MAGEGAASSGNGGRTGGRGGRSGQSGGRSGGGQRGGAGNKSRGRRPGGPGAGGPGRSSGGFGGGGGAGTSKGDDRGPRKPARTGGGKPRGKGKRPSAAPGRGNTEQRGRGPGRRSGPGGYIATDPKRHIVMELLRHQARRWPDLDLVEPESERLDPRDAAFAHALYDIVIRRWLTLRHLISAHLEQPWPKLRPEAKSALLAGTAQLVFMRSVPDHAAVSETVEWISHRSSRGQSGLVNAVLRRVIADIAAGPGRAADPSRLRVASSGVPVNRTDGQSTTPESIAAEEAQAKAARAAEDAERLQQTAWAGEGDALPLDDGTTVRLSRELLPADPLERLAIATSHPVELLAEWVKHMPMRDVRSLALHGLATPPVILNTQHARTPLPEDLVSPHEAPGHHVFLAGRTALERLLAERDDVWVQDPASSLAVQSVIDLEPGLVVDYCAGRGTKTRQLARAFPNARIIATDIDVPRFKYLQRSFAGESNVEVVPFESIRDFVGRADLVLLDVPCSNTGVLARRVEAKYRVDRDRTDSLVGMQRQLIADAIPLLNAAAGAGKAGILYSTCSLDPRENEEQAAWAARWHSFRAAREHRRAPSGGPGRPPETYSDGSYAVLLA
jgi:16S rRNA (cytosine967-C5)-methyltransferase